MTKTRDKSNISCISVIKIWGYFVVVVMVMVVLVVIWCYETLVHLVLGEPILVRI